MKTQIALILLGFGLVSGTVYAAHAEETPLPVANDINVTAPDQPGTWSFGATAVLMQPVNQGYTYATWEDKTYGSGHTFIGETDTPVVLNESYYWWFGADISYAFPGNGRDVTLAYEGLHGSTMDNTSNADNDINNSSGDLSEYTYLISNLPGTTVSDIEAKVDTKYDAGDLLVGQKLDVGSRIQLHPFMGLRYARIDVDDSFADTLGPDTLLGSRNSGTDNGYIKSKFQGIGPRLGSDATVTLGQGFSIHGRLGVSALIGSQNYNMGYVSIAQFISFIDYEREVQNEEDGNPQTRLIPEIDGRLGLNYTYHFNTKTALGIEAGWQATDYFQVVANPYFLGDEATPVRGSNTDFGLQGPYARLQLDLA